MLHPFVSCPASDRRGSRPVVLSAVFHAVLFGIVIAPTRPARLATLPRATAESVRYLSLSLGAHRTSAASAPHRARRSPRRVADEPPPLAPWLATLDVSTAVSLAMPEPFVPELDLPVLRDSLPGGPLDDTPYGTSVRKAGNAGASGYATRADSEAYLAAEVDRSVMALGANPKPGYPAALLRRGVEATFTTFFVVDTAGRIDTATIRIPPSVDARFSKAVRDVLVRWRFVPAEIQGRRVRQLIEQTFKFRISPGAYGSASDFAYR